MSDAIPWDTVPPGGTVSPAAAIKAWLIAGSGLDPSKIFWAYEGVPRPVAPYIEVTLTQVAGIGHDWSTSEDNPFLFADQTVTAVDTTANTLAIASHPFGNGDGPVRIVSSGTLPAPLLVDTDYWVILTDAGHVKLADTYEHSGGQMPLGVGNPITPIDLTTAGSGTIKLQSTESTLAAGKEIIRRAEGQREVTLHLDCYAVEGQGYAAVRILTNVVAQLQLSLYDLDVAGVGVSDFGQGFSQGGVRFVEGRRGSVLEPRAMVDVVVYMVSNITGYSNIIATIDGTVQLKSDGGVDLPAIPVHIVAE